MLRFKTTGVVMCCSIAMTYTAFFLRIFTINAKAILLGSKRSKWGHWRERCHARELRKLQQISVKSSYAQNRPLVTRKLSWKRVKYYQRLRVFSYNNFLSPNFMFENNQNIKYTYRYNVTTVGARVILLCGVRHCLDSSYS